MNRFLRYSLEKDRSVRAVLMVGGALVQKTITVLALDDHSATLRVGRQKPPLVLPYTDILSCDYARGDHGDE